MVYKRQVYTALDWLGDVGGLSDALRLIGQGIMYLYTLIFGNPLSSNLLKNIFVRDSKRGDSIKGETSESKIARIGTRKSFTTVFRCGLCFGRK